MGHNDSLSKKNNSLTGIQLTIIKQIHNRFIEKRETYQYGVIENFKGI